MAACSPGGVRLPQFDERGRKAYTRESRDSLAFKEPKREGKKKGRWSDKERERAAVETLSRI